MAYRIWQFKLEDGTHQVELEHGWFSGKRIIRVDGQLVDRSAQFIDVQTTEHRFEINEHRCMVRVRPTFLSFEFELWVDGRLM